MVCVQLQGLLNSFRLCVTTFESEMFARLCSGSEDYEHLRIGFQILVVWCLEVYEQIEWSQNSFRVYTPRLESEVSESVFKVRGL